MFLQLWTSQCVLNERRFFSAFWIRHFFFFRKDRIVLFTVDTLLRIFSECTKNKTSYFLNERKTRVLKYSLFKYMYTGRKIHIFVVWKIDDSIFIRNVTTTVFLKTRFPKGQFWFFIFNRRVKFKIRYIESSSKNKIL